MFPDFDQIAKDSKEMLDTQKEILSVLCNINDKLDLHGLIVSELNPAKSLPNAIEDF